MFVLYEKRVHGFGMTLVGLVSTEKQAVEYCRQMPGTSFKDVTPDVLINGRCEMLVRMNAEGGGVLPAAPFLALDVSLKELKKDGTYFYRKASSEGKRSKKSSSPPHAKKGRKKK